MSSQVTTTQQSFTELPENMQGRYNTIIDTDLANIRKAMTADTYNPTAEPGLGWYDPKTGQTVEAGTPGARVRPMSDLSVAGMQALTQNNPLSYFDKSDSSLNEYLNTGSNYQGRSIDGIAEWMNPFLMNVLNPQIREQGRAFRNALNVLGDQAFTAGAFGDAQHGVSRGVASDRYAENVNDIVGKGFADAFINAMKAKEDDLKRREALAETATERKRRGAIDLANLGVTKFNTQNRFGTNLLDLGDFEKHAKQDAANMEWRHKNKGLLRDKEMAAFENQILGGIRVPQSTTTTTTEPDNTWSSVWGAGTAALIPQLT